MNRETNHRNIDQYTKTTAPLSVRNWLETSFGGDVNQKDADGLSPLHRASWGDDLLLVDICLSLDADVTCKDEEGWSPASYAASAGNYACLKRLLKGLDIKGESTRHWTLIHCASRFGHADCLEIILKHSEKCLVDALDVDGLTAAHLAASYNSVECLNLLNEYNADFNIRDSYQMLPIHWAAWDGSAAALEFLTWKTRNWLNEEEGDGWTACHLCAANGHTECLKVLSNHGLWNVRGSITQWTPLHCASERGHVNCVHRLLCGGSDVLAKDENGCNPLHLAASSGCAEMVELLCHAGVDMNAKNADGQTPLEIARQLGHDRFCSVLSKFSAPKIRSLLELCRQKLVVNLSDCGLNCNHDDDDFLCYYNNSNNFDNDADFNSPQNTSDSDISTITKQTNTDQKEKKTEQCRRRSSTCECETHILSRRIKKMKEKNLISGEMANFTLGNDDYYNLVVWKQKNEELLGKNHSTGYSHLCQHHQQQRHPQQHHPYHRPLHHHLNN